MLKTGEKIPAICLPDQNGKMISLNDFSGGKLLIFFYSKDNTTGCSKQAVGYSVLADKFAQKGVKIIGISKDIR